MPPPEDLPRLPVARALWRPKPDFATAAEAWLRAGGPHHTVLCRALGTEAFEDLAEIAGIELRRDRRADADPRRRERAALESGVLPARGRPVGASTPTCGSGCSRRTWRSCARASSSSPSGTRARSTVTAGVVAIKPSGVVLRAAAAADIAVVDLATGAVVEGEHAAVLGHADAPRPVPRVARRRRHRAHALPVRHRLGAGASRDPLLRDDARRPLRRRRAGDTCADARRDRRGVRAARRER